MQEFKTVHTPGRGGTYTMTHEDMDYIASFAVNGVVPLDAYVKATTIYSQQEKWK